MMKKILAIGVLISTLVLSACYGPCTTGAGSIITEVRDITGFTGVRNDGDFEVYVTQSEEYSVEVVAYENLIPIIETYISGNSLVVQMKNNSCYKSGPPIEVYVFLPEVDHLELNGSGKLIAYNADSEVLECINNGSGYLSLDTVSANEFYLSNSGSGFVDVKRIFSSELRFVQSGSGTIDGGDVLGSEAVSIEHSSSGSLRANIIEGLELDALLSGSGRIDLSGEVVDVDYALHSSGRIAAVELMATHAVVENTGSGLLYVWATETLTATISGSGDVIYIGDPIISYKITGSGSLRRY